VRHLASLLSGLHRPSPPSAGATGFEQQLEQHTHEREQRIRASLPPTESRHDDDDGYAIDGFLPVPLAAEQMSMSETDLAEQVRRGLLEWTEIGGLIYVRPAIVTVLGAQ